MGFCIGHTYDHVAPEQCCRWCTFGYPVGVTNAQQVIMFFYVAPHTMHTLCPCCTAEHAQALKMPVLLHGFILEARMDNPTKGMLACMR